MLIASRLKQPGTFFLMAVVVVYMLIVCFEAYLVCFEI